MIETKVLKSAMISMKGKLMNEQTAKQVALRIPIGAAFSKAFYKNEDRSKFSNGMGVVPAHHEEDAVETFHRLPGFIRPKETREVYENCDGTIDESIHPATDAVILVTIVDDELVYSYLAIRVFRESDNESFRSYLSDHTFIGPDEVPSDVTVSIDGMTVGQWLRHSQKHPRAIYSSSSTDWTARVV